MFQSSNAVFHLHGSNAFVKGSALCRADLMYCRVTCGSLNNSYKADKFSLCTFLRCPNFALYPPWTIWMTEALSCCHTKLMGLFNTKSKRSGLTKHAWVKRNDLGFTSAPSSCALALRSPTQRPERIRSLERQKHSGCWLYVFYSGGMVCISVQRQMQGSSRMWPSSM